MEGNIVAGLMVSVWTSVEEVIILPTAVLIAEDHQVSEGAKLDTENQTKTN